MTMHETTRALGSSLGLILILLSTPAGAVTTLDFEDVGSNLPVDGNPYYQGADGAAGFQSQGANFSNSFTDFGGGFTAWDGWSYSQATDVLTPGFGNQFSAYAGGGVGGSATYGVAFPGTFGDPSISTITFASEVDVLGAYLSNTTYAALSMLNGDGFSEKFGGTDGTEPDWLLLTVHGFDGLGDVTGTVDFYLADYRFANDALDYVVDTWTWIDLTGLGPVASLDFTLSGSDTGEFGLNTPAYFALDDLVVVPEPGTAALLAVGLALLAATRRSG